MKPVSSEWNNAWIQDEMYLTAKLRIEFGSNRFNDGQVVTSTPTKLANRGVNSLRTSSVKFWRPEDAFNNKNTNTMKWLVCDAGATVNEEADGTGYRCIHLDDEDLETEYERGWWSEAKSDETGVFEDPQYVQSEFYEMDGETPKGRRANKIVLYTMDGYPNMKDVRVEYKDANGDWLPVDDAYPTGRELGSNEWESVWYDEIDTVEELMIFGLRVEIESTWETDDWARINELNAYWIKDIDQEQIVSIDVKESREEFDRTVPVGTTTANTLDFELDNIEGLYNSFNDDSPYAPYIGSGCRVEPYFGIDINSGNPDEGVEIEWLQMGEYWTDEWDAGSGSMTVSVNCRDFSRYLQDDVLSWGRVWVNNNIEPVMRDMLLQLGMPLDRIHINTTNLRGYNILFIEDDKDPWSFMGELALADQGMFGFDNDGDFYYESYNILNDEPYTSPVMNLDWNTNVIEGNFRTELYANKVKVEISPYATEELGVKGIWSAESPTILSYARCNATVAPDATTIPVQAAARQSDGNLTSNGWPEKNGFIFIPIINPTDGEVLGGELVKYATRTDSQFEGCTRGYMGTVALELSSDTYLGEARVFDVEFDNTPAIQVKYPFVTAIDTLAKTEGEHPQAYVISWNHDAFKGRLAIGNTTEYLTWLAGTGQTVRDYDDTTSSSELSFGTSIAGTVSHETSNEAAVKIDDPEAQNLDYIRRYGKNEIEIKNQWVQTKEHGEDIANVLIDEYKIPRRLLDLSTITNPALRMGDRVRLTNFPQLDIENIDFHVMSASYSYDGGLNVNLTMREVKPD